MYKVTIPSKKRLASLFAVSTMLFIFSFRSIAQTPPVLAFTQSISTGLSSTVDVVNAGDGTNRLFIVRQGGTIRIISGGVLLPGIFLDMSGSISTGSERGLLSMAFHPDYINNRYFFIYYTNTSGDISISRFQTLAENPNAADAGSGVVLLTIPHAANTNHNGGKLAFGPDGNLYFGTGDGGGTGDPNNLAQDGNSLLGKFIRINVDNFTTPPYYSIPPDNPFAAKPGYRGEIYALGLRNPWRWSFDRLNDDVWIADVGQSAWEEINSNPVATVSGINYGWRCYEGNATYNTAGCQTQNFYEFPVFAYPHNSSTGGYSVTGGYVYRGAEYPALDGYYICSDYISGNTWLIKSTGTGGWNVSQQSGLPGSICSFGEAENGELYALSLSGTLYKVTTSAVLPLTWRLFTGKVFTGYNELLWKTANEQDLSYFEIEFSFDGINYTSAGKINAVNLVTENNYSFQHFITDFTRLFYRIKTRNKDGNLTYSNVITLNKDEKNLIRVYPSPVTKDQLNIISGKAIEQLTLFSTEGKTVFQTRLNSISGTINVPLPHLQSGIYFLQLKTKDGLVNEKILIQQE